MSFVTNLLQLVHPSSPLSPCQYIDISKMLLWWGEVANHGNFPMNFQLDDWGEIYVGSNHCFHDSFRNKCVWAPSDNHENNVFEVLGILSTYQEIDHVSFVHSHHYDSFYWKNRQYHGEILIWCSFHLTNQIKIFLVDIVWPNIEIRWLQELDSIHYKGRWRMG